jgi:CRP-like cAMP-binding protein
MTVSEGFRKIKALAAANPASLAELIPHGTLRQYQKGEHIFFEKDPAEQFYFLADGFAALYKLNSNGEKRGIFIYGAGASLNEVILDKKPASINCEILKESLVLCLNRDLFMGVCARDFALTKAFMESMSLKIRRLYHQIKNTSNTIHLDKRIAARLWKLSKDHGLPVKEGVEINFDLSITFLAELLGSQRETVSRKLKPLTDQGLVIMSKNRFIIPDREKLMDYFYDP